MKLRILTSALGTVAIAACLSVAHAEGQGRGSGGSASQESPAQARDKHDVGKAQHHYDAEHARKRSKKHHLEDEDIYGHEMMTAEERERYREQLNAAGSDREWAQLRAEHQEAMRQRAEAQQRMLEEPIYGQHMMTAEERKQFVERMQAARSEAERAEVREQHRETIKARARELGIDPENPKR